ncbi:MAG: hypothetical protein ACLQDM_22080 [Bradyrhizobium sp.]
MSAPAMTARFRYIAASIWLETTQTNWPGRFLVDVRRLAGALLSLPMMMVATLGKRKEQTVFAQKISSQARHSKSVQDRLPNAATAPIQL